MSKKKKWYACEMDEGVIASGNTFKELLAKFGRSSAIYVMKGDYMFYEDTEHHRTTIYVYHGEEIVKANGFDIHAEYNTWHIDERAE